MLTTSDNSTAEMMLKEIGYQSKGEGTAPLGAGVMRRLATWGARHGVNPC
jgi:D-alanyl-D-alanine carboxypeptidase